jgi:hypothetical protein
MPELMLSDDDGSTLAIRLWYDVPEELIEQLVSYLGPPKVTGLLPAETRSAIKAAGETAGGTIVDVATPDA